MSSIWPASFVLLAALAGLASCKTDIAPEAVAQASTRPPPLSTAVNTEAASRGRAIAVSGCSGCHAIDASGSSTLLAAPPFRDIVDRRSLDDLETSFAQGLVTTHPAMPPYVFRASEIDDLIAYLDSL
jgi:mono/diheme cytochrome c family protein